MLAFLRQLAPVRAPALKSTSATRALASNRAPLDVRALGEQPQGYASAPDGARAEATPSAVFAAARGGALGDGARSGWSVGSGLHSAALGAPHGPLFETRVSDAIGGHPTGVGVEPMATVGGASSVGSARTPLRAAALDASLSAADELPERAAEPSVGPRSRAPERARSYLQPTHQQIELGVLSTSAGAPLSEAVVALARPSSANAAPVIHVSIDRLEVRAPAAPSRAPAQSARSASSTQSLHDYLHRKARR